MKKETKKKIIKYFERKVMKCSDCNSMFLLRNIEVDEYLLKCGKCVSCAFECFKKIYNLVNDRNYDKINQINKELKDISCPGFGSKNNIEDLILDSWDEDVDCMNVFIYCIDCFDMIGDIESIKKSDYYCYLDQIILLE